MIPGVRHVRTGFVWIVALKDLSYVDTLTDAEPVQPLHVLVEVQDEGLQQRIIVFELVVHVLELCYDVFAREEISLGHAEEVPHVSIVL